MDVGEVQLKGASDQLQQLTSTQQLQQLTSQPVDENSKLLLYVVLGLFGVTATGVGESSISCSSHCYCNYSAVCLYDPSCHHNMDCSHRSYVSHSGPFSQAHKGLCCIFEHAIVYALHKVRVPGIHNPGLSVKLQMLVAAGAQAK